MSIFIRSRHLPYPGPRPKSVADSRDEFLDPHPQPWRQGTDYVESAVAYIVDVVGMKEVALQVKGPLQKQLIQNADAATAAFVDDVCGTPPGHLPWPWPGPGPVEAAVISQMIYVANTLQDGVMRRELVGICARVAEKSTQLRPQATLT